MDQPINNSQWLQYLEIPERKRAPIKLEHILAARIEAFMRAKKVRSEHGPKTKNT